MNPKDCLLALFDKYARLLLSAEPDEDTTNWALTEFSRLLANLGSKTIDNDELGRLRVANGLVRAKRAFEQDLYEGAWFIMQRVAAEPLYQEIHVSRDQLDELAKLTREFRSVRQALAPSN